MPSAPGDITCACQHCGGHIAFPAEGLGLSVACPHCQQSTLLRKPATPKSALPLFLLFGLAVGALAAAFLLLAPSQPEQAARAEWQRCENVRVQQAAVAAKWQKAVAGGLISLHNPQLLAANEAVKTAQTRVQLAAQLIRQCQRQRYFRIGGCLALSVLATGAALYQVYRRD